EQRRLRDQQRPALAEARLVELEVERETPLGVDLELGRAHEGHSALLELDAHRPERGEPPGRHAFAPELPREAALAFDQRHRDPARGEQQREARACGPCADDDDTLAHRFASTSSANKRTLSKASAGGVPPHSGYSTNAA